MVVAGRFDRAEVLRGRRDDADPNPIELLSEFGLAAQTKIAILPCF